MTIQTARSAADNNRRYHEKVLDHATRRLSRNSDDATKEVQSLRRFLQLEDERLRMAVRHGQSGRWLSEARCFVLDVAVQHAYLQAKSHSRTLTARESAGSVMTVVALGGYGRGELAPFSDLDLLFLHIGRWTSYLQETMECMLRLLWDSGLTIGHSFRTVKDCISASRGDLHLATALTSTRLVAGSPTVYGSLTTALERARRNHGPFIKAVSRERDHRYSKFGDAVCLQEPNVKESAGGLRDLHTALWVAYAEYGSKSLKELLDRNVISRKEHDVAERSYDFLLRVRYQAHLLSGRKVDRISLDLQPPLAREFGYASDHKLVASEKFMRDYYKRALDLYLVADSVISRASEGAKLPSRWFGRHRRVLLSEHFSIEDGKLQLGPKPVSFVANPLLMFEAFGLTQAAMVPLGHTLTDAIRSSLFLIDRKFRSSGEAADAFLKLLRWRGRVGHILRVLHQVGFLRRYLPEFGRISLLIQHDLYHSYTIDEHTLRVVEALDELSNGDDSRRANLRSVLEEVEDPAVLYLSLLLHDIGKGQGPGHVPRGVKIAERICKRLQLSKTQSAKVLSLVAHHITMAHISQRRDLTEPHVASEFAAEMKTKDELNMLLLLSYADMNGVGPGVWSEWKGHLLWDLYERSRIHLVEADPPASGEVQLAELRDNVLTRLSGEFPRSVVERHLALLPDRYLRTTTPEATAQHLRLIERLNKDSLCMHWEQKGKGITELTICGHDRLGLFADIAGTLTIKGVEILRAEVNTREDGIAIDVFILRVAATHMAIEESRCARIERALRAANVGECDVPALVEKWQTQQASRKRFKPTNNRHKMLIHVTCDNTAAQAATVVEVRASDEVGLAYKIASVATALGLQITYAKITTEKSDAFDVFYVVDANGMRLSEEAMRRLEAMMVEEISRKQEQPRLSKQLPQLLTEVPSH